MRYPPERDFGFYQRRKHDVWREVPVPSPALEAAVADSHAHIHSLPDPAWELVRCAANGVDFVCSIVDPSEDGSRPFDELDSWIEAAEKAKNRGETRNLHANAEISSQNGISRQFQSGNGAIKPLQTADRGEKSPNQPDLEGKSANERDSVTDFERSRVNLQETAIPGVKLAAGIHPHNAKLYDDAAEQELLSRLADPRVVALGEIGLDFYYDLSPRDVQERVFRRQIAIAKELGLPVVLHLRGGKDPKTDNAHRQAFGILQEVGFPERGTLLHCCSLPPDELVPWVEADCYVAYGGALTFKSSDAAREGACIVPEDRLLVETDSPYMTPEPMRGVGCTPAHVIFTAAALAEVRGIAPGEARQAFLEQLHANTLQFYSSRYEEDAS